MVRFVDSKCFSGVKCFAFRFRHTALRVWRGALYASHPYALLPLCIARRIRQLAEKESLVAFSKNGSIIML